MKTNLSVLILCGGKGERLKPLTESIPKPLVPINGRPILSYLLDHITKFNIQNVVIAAGYRAEKIHDFFEHSHKHLNVSIVDSGDVDIIERIKACKSHLPQDFIVLYGDTLADVNLEQLYHFHQSHHKPATITLWQLKSQFGLAEIDDDDNVINFREKPLLDQWINIGNFYYNHEMLDLMNGFNSYAKFLEHIGAQKKLKAFRHKGIHITVNTLRELEDAEQNINQFKL